MTVSPEEAVMAGLARQRQMRIEVNGYIKDCEKIQNIIALLRQFKNCPKGGILTELKARGMDPQGEKDSELESWSSIKIDKLDAERQTIFREKIRPLNRAIDEVGESIHKNYLQFLLA